MVVIGKVNKGARILAITISAVLMLVLFAAMFFIYKEKLNLAMPILIIPFLIVFLTAIFYSPRFGLLSAFIANYFVMGIARYIHGPLGLSIDSLLVLTWLAVFFSQFNKKVEWAKAWNGLTIAALVWFIYALFQFFNPESVSRVAWFYAMRGVSMYMLLTVPLVCLLFNNRIYLDKMLRLWAWFTLVGVLKGIMQHIIGPDPWEQYWLDTIGGKTHILPQGLRIFSFFTDSSTFGGSMGLSGVVFSIVALNLNHTRKKLFYGFVALVAFYGMIISGTRGAIAVPFAGFAFYAIVSKNFKMLIIGGLLIIGSFSFLKYTTKGNSFYEIRRIRTALDPDNPSLTVRKDNQKLIKNYLISRPFGGGIGSAGNWGLRFSPNTFLAETPPDGWYIQIWAEQGRVGISLHLAILLYILIHGAYLIMFKLKQPELRGKAAALLSGIFGVMVASYSSNALGQMPNGIIIYVSMAFIFMMRGWEKQEETEIEYKSGNIS